MTIAILRAIVYSRAEDDIYPLKRIVGCLPPTTEALNGVPLLLFWRSPVRFRVLIFLVCFLLLAAVQHESPDVLREFKAA